MAKQFQQELDDINGNIAMTHSDIVSAIMSIRPGSEWTLNGPDFTGLTWLDQKTVAPTLAEVQQAINTLTQQAALNKGNVVAAQLVLANKLSTTDQKVNAIITILAPTLIPETANQTLPT